MSRSRSRSRSASNGTIPRGRSSSFAAEGTVAHEVRSLSLELGLDAHDWIGKTFSADGLEFEVTEEMANHLQPGMDRVREQPGRMLIEQRVKLEGWLPGQWGTLDCGIHDPAGRVIHIDDLKYGAGVPVSAVGNRQLRIYALGFWRHFCEADNRIERFVLTIDQPRAGGFKTWEVPTGDLLAFGDEVRAAGLATMEPDAPLKAGEKGCRFCPVKNTDDGCPAYDRWMRDLMVDAFDDLDDPDDKPVMADPDALDWEYFADALHTLRQGRACRLPVYDFETHRRRPDAELLQSELQQAVAATGLPRLRSTSRTYCARAAGSAISRSMRSL